MKDFKHYLSIVNESMFKFDTMKESLMDQIGGMTEELASKIETKINEIYSRGKTRDAYAARKRYSFIFYTDGNQEEEEAYNIAKEGLEIEASNDSYAWENGKVTVKVDGEYKTYGFTYMYNPLKAQGPPPRFRNMYDSEPGIDRSQYE